MICLFVIDGVPFADPTSCFTCCKGQQLGSSTMTSQQVCQLQGHPGKVGPMGMPGRRGEKGQRGEVGPMGFPGRIGEKGQRGKRGANGKRGPNGLPAARGEKGEAGECRSDAEALASLAKKYEHLLNLSMKLQSELTYMSNTCSVSTAGIQYSNIIEDRQLTASSNGVDRLRYQPRFGRLHSTVGAGWLMSSPFRVGEWLQVDLEKNRRIFGVATQGGQGISWNYVKKYKIQYKKEGQESFDTMQDDEGNEKIFKGNVYGADLTVKNNFDQPFTARYVRIFPITWNDFPVIRWELLVC